MLKQHYPTILGSGLAFAQNKSSAKTFSKNDFCGLAIFGGFVF